MVDLSLVLEMFRVGIFGFTVFSAGALLKDLLLQVWKDVV